MDNGEMITPTWMVSRIPSIVLAPLMSSIVVLSAPGNIGAESSFFRQPIVVDYAEDRTFCRTLIREHTDPDDNFRLHYHLVPPPGVTDENSLFDYDQPPGEKDPQRYRRGRFDFDNDGIIDFVYGVTESTRSFSGDRYFIFINTPQPGADLPEEEQPPYEPWPDGFGLEWLITQSRYVFPDMWGDCRSYSKYCGRDNLNHDAYTLRHQKSKNPTRYKFEELYSRPFRLRDVTYLLLVPNHARDLGALLRPKPNKAVEEACVFRRKPAPK